MIRRLWDHLAWADQRISVELTKATDTSRRECAHILGAEATWLARLQGVASRTPIWPEMTRDEIETLRAELAAAYRDLLATLQDDDLDRIVSYANSAGTVFRNTVGDILLHVALHGQYHRGKINLLLRQNGGEPSPVDFIAYARDEGVIAAPPP
jgi:uncharacterized damage-inducible protein DinB